MHEHGQESTEGHPGEANEIGLWYDSDRLVLVGVYRDEVTAYRARRGWIEALEKNFLLEERHDFAIKVRTAYGGKNFKVRCDFLTACGRYAFWRLTNHQAPEVQFLLETAHLPHIGLDVIGRIADFHEQESSVCSTDGLHNDVASVSIPRMKLTRALNCIRVLARRMLDGVISKHSSLN